MTRKPCDYTPEESKAAQLKWPKKLLKVLAIPLAGAGLVVGLLVLPFFALAEGIKKRDGDEVRTAIKLMGFTALNFAVLLFISLLITII